MTTEKQETINRIDDAVSELIDVIDFNYSELEDAVRHNIEDMIEELNEISNRLEEEQTNNKKKG
tara:strand:+ start:86 stop:277 length:192 start_codon:yes stop_codon:yes gene_type:complete